jgi:hypothetical protein
MILVGLHVGNQWGLPTDFNTGLQQFTQLTAVEQFAVFV